MKIIHIVDGEQTGQAQSGTLDLSRQLAQRHEISSVRLCGRQAAVCAADRPDLIYCHGLQAARRGEKMAKQYGVPFVMECGGLDLNRCGRRARRLLCRADRCVAVRGQENTLLELGADPMRVTGICSTAEQLCELYESTVQQFARRAGSGRDGAVICGAYGRGNAGDDAILNAIVRELHQADAQLPVCVVSRRPEETRRRNHVQACHTFHFGALSRALRRASVFISGGGSLIQNATSSRSLYYYLFMLYLARRRGCKVMMYGCGIGPVYGWLHRRMAAHVINRCVDIVTLRDDDSMGELKNMGVTRPKMLRTADPTICIQQLESGQTEQLLERLHIPRSGAYIGFGLREWKGFDRAAPEIARAAQYAWEKYGLTPVFIPIEYPHDCEAAKKVAVHLRCPYFLIAQRMAISETISLLSRMSLVVGMRLHSLIFSVENGVPSIGISYDMKVDGFLRSIGREDVTLHVQNVTGQQLMEQIDRAVRSEERSRWKQTAARLTAEESGNLKQVRALLASLPQQELRRKHSRDEGDHQDGK